ncbi:hypothetical protein F2Q70_00007996 [Brassica cretica]|uniref:Uncharacterized protein n=1 Tax=Brassica cretica TaxID=69181 RepID=A0A8S9MGA1_BRACR|nr:hypothetical protein F2Q70_00007996 [Brassica cretica]
MTFAEQIDQIEIKMGESTKIVELYTRRIHDANEMRIRNQTTSEVGVEGKKFSRTLFRANDGGPDILVNQVVQSPRTFYYNLPLPVIQSTRAFRQFISASPSAQQELNRVTPPRRVHNSLVNEWSWSSVTSHIVRHVSESIDLSTLTPADRFACYCDEAFGDLFILDGRALSFMSTKSLLLLSECGFDVVSVDYALLQFKLQFMSGTVIEDAETAKNIQENDRTNAPGSSPMVSGVHDLEISLLWRTMQRVMVMMLSGDAVNRPQVCDYSYKYPNETAEQVCCLLCCVRS